MAKLIPRNTRIPAEKTITITTSQDNQRTICLKVFMGERSMTKDCLLFGRFDFGGIEAAPRGAHRFNVTVKVLDDGGLDFRVKHLKVDGKAEGMSMRDYLEGLSQEDVERMVQEATEYAAEDTRARESINGRTSLQNFMYTVRVELNDQYKLKGMIGDAERDRIERVLKETNEWLDENQHGVGREEYDEKLSIVSKSIGPFVDDGARVPSEPVPP
jgi:heat shock protein 5